MGLGIRRSFIKTADTVVTNSVVLVTTGLTSAIAASETQNVKWWVPFTVGATGGVRAQVVVPAGGTIFLASILLVDVTGNVITADTQTVSAAFANALAVAATHWLEITATIVNGATAGNIDLQMAQNTADALSLTILRGGFADVIIP